MGTLAAKRAQLFKFMGKPLYAQSYNADGTMTEEVVAEDSSLLDSVIKQRVSEELGKEKASRAARRLEKLSAGDTAPTIHRVDVEGDDEPWWVLALDMEGLTRVGLLCPRDKKRRIQLGAKGNFTALLTAMLLICCVGGENDETPFFETWDQAWDQAASRKRGAVSSNSQLFAAILAINPDILPGGDEDEEEDGDADPKAPATDSPAVTQSSPPATTEPGDGTTETPSTSAPASSPTDS